MHHIVYGVTVFLSPYTSLCVLVSMSLSSCPCFRILVLVSVLSCASPPLTGRHAPMPACHRAPVPFSSLAHPIPCSTARLRLRSCPVLVLPPPTAALHRLPVTELHHSVPAALMSNSHPPVTSGHATPFAYRHTTVLSLSSSSSHPQQPEALPDPAVTEM